MKVTNKTAYATIGCDVQLSENDRLALGIELDKVTNWLDSADYPKGTTESAKAINNIVTFISKFAIRPSKTNVFTDSPEDFKKAYETVDTDDEKIREELLEHCINRRDGKQVCVDASDYRRWADWLGKQENKADETDATDEPSPEDNVITVDISNCKNMTDLARVIFHATDWDLTNIIKSLREAKKTHVSCISFKCTEKYKEEVVDELTDHGYTIASNTVESLQLDTY